MCFYKGKLTAGKNSACGLKKKTPKTKHTHPKPTTSQTLEDDDRISFIIHSHAIKLGRHHCGTQHI